MAAARLRLRAALAYFGVFLLGYMLVAVGRPAALAMKAAGEAALVRARSAVAPGSGAVPRGPSSPPPAFPPPRPGCRWT